MQPHSCSVSLLFAVDGRYTQWGEWSECSTTCDPGSRKRERSCTNPPPQNGGKDCSSLGEASQTKWCNTGKKQQCKGRSSLKKKIEPRRIICSYSVIVRLKVALKKKKKNCCLRLMSSQPERTTPTSASAVETSVTKRSSFNNYSVSSKQSHSNYCGSFLSCSCNSRRSSVLKKTYPF